MILVFELSMPNVGSWNGAWTGSKNYYAIVRKFTSKAFREKGRQMLDKGHFHYSFGDGWRAGISVKEVDGAGSRQARRRTKGFCGYDWMVDSIIQDLTITAPSERLERANAEGGEA